MKKLFVLILLLLFSACRGCGVPAFGCSCVCDGVVTDGTAIYYTGDTQDEAPVHRNHALENITNRCAGGFEIVNEDNEAGIIKYKCQPQKAEKE